MVSLGARIDKIRTTDDSMSILSVPALCWIVVTVACAWALPRKWQVPAVSVITIFVLAYYSTVSLTILFVSSTSVFFLIRYTTIKRVVVMTAIGSLAALFIWIKIETQLGSGTSGEEILVPLGFSYYTLRQIHYVLESYKGKLRPHGFLDYFCYLFFIPTIQVGPIHRFPDFLRDLKRRRWDSSLISNGLERILYGYAKIVVLGNYLVSKKLTLMILQLEPVYPGIAAYLDCVRYGLNLYFQFGGYSDIAVGFSMLLGFRIIENFHFPFLAQNINDFWQRWHISLSRWCRDYVYIPVISFSRQPAMAAVASMLVLGLWHELSLRYLLWALYHGIGIAVWQQFRRLRDSNPKEARPWALRLKIGFSAIFTLNFVILSFALTKEKTVSAAVDVYRNIFTF